MKKESMTSTERFLTVMFLVAVCTPIVAYLFEENKPPEGCTPIVNGVQPFECFEDLHLFREDLLKIMDNANEVIYDPIVSERERKVKQSQHDIAMDNYQWASDFIRLGYDPELDKNMGILGENK